MNITPWRRRGGRLDLFEPLEDIRKEMNRLFDVSFPGKWEEGYMMTPAVDITDEKDHITVTADLPGLKKDQIQVSLEDDVLTIKGEKKEEKETKEKNYIRTERSYGGFQRSFTLPTIVDGKNVKASYKEGVLEVILPKKEGAKPKQIDVDIN